MYYTDLLPSELIYIILSYVLEDNIITFYSYDNLSLSNVFDHDIIYNSTFWKWLFKELKLPTMNYNLVDIKSNIISHDIYFMFLWELTNIQRSIKFTEELLNKHFTVDVPLCYINDITFLFNHIETENNKLETGVMELLDDVNYRDACDLDYIYIHKGENSTEIRLVLDGEFEEIEIYDKKQFLSELFRMLFYNKRKLDIKIIPDLIMI